MANDFQHIYELHKNGLLSDKLFHKKIVEQINTPSFIGVDTAGKMGDTVKIRQPATEKTPLDMIAMRLRLMPGQRFPMKDIHAYTDSGVAYVFVVNTDGKYVVIEDDPDLFPSDKLITQLRLLIG